VTSKVIQMECPGCGAPVNTSQKNCDFCKGPIVISTFNSVSSMGVPLLNKYANSYRDALSSAPGDPQLSGAIALCYMKLKLFDKALPAFERAIESNFDNSEMYFCASVCVFRGQRPFLSSRESVDRAISLLQAALAIEPRGIYHYLEAFIRHDYFERKFFRIQPGYKACLAAARAAGLSEHDISSLHELISVARPAALS
jgi:tetratricopeptide (TPR) repeat protein